jgi:hypothetical protein
MRIWEHEWAGVGSIRKELTRESRRRKRECPRACQGSPKSNFANGQPTKPMFRRRRTVTPRQAMALVAFVDTTSTLQIGGPRCVRAGFDGFDGPARLERLSN